MKLLGLAVFFLVGGMVAARLLLLWRRTGGLPELLSGLALLGIGPLGFCVLMSGYLVFRDTGAFAWLRGSGLLIQALGFVAVVAFTRRVFRPREGWATAWMSALALGLLATGIASVTRPVDAGGMALRHHMDTLLKIVALGWGAFEALRYWRGTRRRVALGMASPLVSASFLLWGVALGAGVVGFVVVYAALLALEPGGHLSTSIQLTLSALGVVSAAALYLSFLPPGFYRRMLTAGPPAAEAC